MSLACIDPKAHTNVVEFFISPDRKKEDRLVARGAGRVVLLRESTQIYFFPPISPTTVDNPYTVEWFLIAAWIQAVLHFPPFTFGQPTGKRVRAASKIVAGFSMSLPIVHIDR